MVGDKTCRFYETVYLDGEVICPGSACMRCEKGEWVDSEEKK